jgi:hypothetical protein
VRLQEPHLYRDGIFKLVASWEKRINILRNCVEKQCLVNIPFWTSPYLTTKNSTACLIYLWHLLTKYCTSIFNLYADKDGKYKNNFLLQQQEKLCCNLNHNFSLITVTATVFSISETYETRRYLHKGTKSSTTNRILNNRIMKYCNTSSNGTDGRTFAPHFAFIVVAVLTRNTYCNGFLLSVDVSAFPLCHYA